jgi:ring-1,2-phenylacetyl-CoA epoxidase subunit PaaD
MVRQADEHTERAKRDGDGAGPSRAATVEARVREALESVHDPEIPPLSIADLGIVERVTVTDEEVHVDLLPTFAGCPALDVIRDDVASAVTPIAGGRAVEIRFVYAPPWTSDRISEAGRAALLEYGLAPPAGGSLAQGPVRLALGRPPTAPGPVRCPYCGSDQTTLESAFGPTLCRSVHVCGACRNVFEAFKPKLAAPEGRRDRPGP